MYTHLNAPPGWFPWDDYEDYPPEPDEENVCVVCEVSVLKGKTYCGPSCERTDEEGLV
jgi:hypothetical protein